jgi:hypothetical protein
MNYIEAPEIYKGKDRSLFLAGGISNCGNWQNELVAMLSNENITILNPRRKKFPTDNPDIDVEQITWEYNHLRKADAVSFWFPDETVCPITLYELGAWSMEKKPLFIGVNPNYVRRRDVEIQTKLVRPEIEIVYSLDKLAEQLIEWE